MDNENITQASDTADNAQDVAEDTTETQSADDGESGETERIKQLEAQLKAARIATEAANREKKKLERAQMSEADQIAATKRELNCERAAVKAEKILANLLPEDEISEFVGLFASEDIEKTSAIASTFRGIYERGCLNAVRVDAEKRLKNMPILHTGGADSLSTDGVKLAASLGKQAAQTNTASNDVLKHYLGG